eukprot:1775611-Pyramimonas_sp.AAC.1
MTLFYGSSCANNSKDALDTPAGNVFTHLEARLVDAAGLDRVHDLGDVRSAAGGAEHGAALVLDPVALVGVEADHVLAVEPAVAVAHAVDALHAVVALQARHHLANHRVQPGAQPAARHHCRHHLVRVEHNLPPMPNTTPNQT